MIKIYPNRVKIERYDSGWVITIKEKNWTKIGNYKTPCYIKYQGKMIELHNDFLIYHSDNNHFTNKNDYVYQGEKFQKILPQLLEFGELLPRDEENNPIFTEEKTN